MAFADQLRKLMNNKNMKAVELARITGLSEAAISDYLKGKKEPRGRQSIAIAKALDVSLDTLWETGFDVEGIIFEGQSNQLTELASATLKKLKPEYQEYILKQIDQLLDIQRKENEKQ